MFNVSIKATRTNKDCEDFIVKKSKAFNYLRIIGIEYTTIVNRCSEIITFQIVDRKALFNFLQLCGVEPPIIVSSLKVWQEFDKSAITLNNSDVIIISR